MSLIKKADVKNHLSARHRTEIHLQPDSQADATGFPHDDNAGDDPKATESVKDSLKLSSRGGPETAPTATASESHQVLVSGQTKSAQA
jgi:hypothetical protein